MLFSFFLFRVSLSLFLSVKINIGLCGLISDKAQPEKCARECHVPIKSHRHITRHGSLFFYCSCRCFSDCCCRKPSTTRVPLLAQKYLCSYTKCDDTVVACIIWVARLLQVQENNSASDKCLSFNRYISGNGLLYLVCLENNLKLVLMYTFLRCII